jgi:deazaflavin-dependent oxidoreductase (nitroreductase family)
MNDFNAKVIEEFHANEGRVGGNFAGAPLLLLHHTGARSGKSYVNPLVYLGDGDRYVIFASKAGAPTNPDWYHNLKANPQVKIEVGTETIDVVVSEAAGEERERLFQGQVDRMPTFAEYKEKAGGREIPVLVLTPA